MLKKTCLALIWACASQLAQAESYALLVGVTEYPALKPQQQLKGPLNDVFLMAALLPQFGYSEENIKLLNGKLGTPATPTRANIMAELHALSKRVIAGDRVWIYFAGHGSQQPRKGKNSNGDREGIFLPSDVGRWDSKFSRVHNAITGEEITTALQAIRDRGASVVALFDTCHAMALARGRDDSVQWRHIPPSELGVPANALSARHERGLGHPATITNLQGVTSTAPWIIWYASLSQEATPEVAYKDGANVTVHGLFTRTVAEVLSQHPQQTWQQANERVLARYAAQHRTRPTPLLEGNAIHQNMFGSDITLHSGQWPLQRSAVNGAWQIPAGTLSGIQAKMQLAIFANPNDPDYTRLHEMTVTSVGPLTATLKADSAFTPPPGAWAKPAKAAAPALINLLLDKRSAPTHVLAALAMLEKKHPAGLTIDVPEAGNSTTIKVSYSAPHAVFKAGDEELLRISAKTNGAQLYAQLFTALQRLIRTSRLNQALATNVPPRFSRDLLLEIGTEKKSAWAPLSKGIPTLHPPQNIKVRLTNNHNRDIDVTVLFQNSHHELRTIYPRNAGETNRLAAGRNIEFDFDLNAFPLGVERVVLLAVEAEPTVAVADFRYLSDGPVATTRNLESNIESSWDWLLERRHFPPAATRGAALARPSHVQAITWRTVRKTISP